MATAGDKYAAACKGYGHRPYKTAINQRRDISITGEKPGITEDEAISNDIELSYKSRPV